MSDCNGIAVQNHGSSYNCDYSLSIDGRWERAGEGVVDMERSDNYCMTPRSLDCMEPLPPGVELSGILLGMGPVWAHTDRLASGPGEGVVGSDSDLGGRMWG